MTSSGRDPALDGSGDPADPADDVLAEGPAEPDDADTTAPHGDPLAPAPGDPSAEDPDDPELSLEEYADLVTRERDDYFEAWRRTQADFENYRKRIMKQQAESTQRAAESLAEKLLPVLDACDGAVRHVSVEVEPVFAALLGALEKEGLARLDPLGEPFDPNIHEAVMHEPGEGDTVVTDVMRTGYLWKGRVLRPAMVKVQG
ncbi:nucleotide exchange factor GrpE [soil metagenome]